MASPGTDDPPVPPTPKFGPQHAQGTVLPDEDWEHTPHIDPMGALPEPSLRTHILGWGHQLAAQLKKLAEHKQGLEPEEITYHQFIELTRQLNTTRTVIHDLAQPEEHQSPNLVIAARYNLTRIASLALGMLDADEVHPLSKRCGDPDLANRLSAMRRDARDVPDARDPTPWTYLYENARPDFDQLIALCHDKTIVRELRAKAEAAAGRRLMRQSFQSQHRTLIEQAKNSMSKVAQGPQHESDVLATLQIVGLFAQISQQTSAFLGMSIVAGTRIAWSPAAVALADRTASSRQWAIGISKRELERLRRSIDATAQRAAGPADWLAQHLHGPLDTAQEHRPQDAAQPPPQTPPDTSTDPDRPDPEQKDTPTPKFEGSPSSPIDESQRIASKLHDTVRRMPNTLRARINRQLRQTAERDGTAPTPIAWHLLQGSGTARRVRHLLSRNIRTGADDPAIADAIRTGTPLPPTVSASLEALWTLSAGALNRAGEPPGAPAALVSDTEAMLAHLADIERAHEGLTRAGSTAHSLLEHPKIQPILERDHHASDRQIVLATRKLNALSGRIDRQSRSDYDVEEIMMRCEAVWHRFQPEVRKGFAQMHVADAPAPGETPAPHHRSAPPTEANEWIPDVAHPAQARWLAQASSKLREHLRTLEQTLREESGTPEQTPFADRTGPLHGRSRPDDPHAATPAEPETTPPPPRRPNTGPSL